MELAIIIGVLASFFGLIVVMPMVVDRFDARRLRKKARRELDSESVEQICARLDEARTALEAEEAHLKANAGTYAGSGNINSLQRGIYNRMRAVDRYRAIVLSVANRLSAQD